MGPHPHPLLLPGATAEEMEAWWGLQAWVGMEPLGLTCLNSEPCQSESCLESSSPRKGFKSIWAKRAARDCLIHRQLRAKQGHDHIHQLSGLWSLQPRQYPQQGEWSATSYTDACTSVYNFMLKVNYVCPWLWSEILAHENVACTHIGKIKILRNTHGLKTHFHH